MGILSWASRAVPAIVVGLRYMADSGLAICVQIQCARLRLKSRVPKTRRGRSICVPGGFQSFEFFLSAFVRALTLNLSVVARYDRKGLRLFSFWGVCDNNDGGCQVSMLWCSFLVTRIDRGLSIAASYLESSPVRRLSSPLDMSSRLLITVPLAAAWSDPINCTSFFMLLKPSDISCLCFIPSGKDIIFGRSTSNWRISPSQLPNPCDELVMYAYCTSTGEVGCIIRRRLFLTFQTIFFFLVSTSDEPSHLTP